jgi:type IV pilus assembly protein PilA
MPAYGGPPVGSRGQGGGGFPTWALVLVIVVLVLFFGGGIMAVLSIYGVRKYIANAKTAEARNALGQIARDAATAYERESVSGSTIQHRVCPSASSPVPADRNLVSGKKYQSTAAEWNVDKAREAGFACLRFEMAMPQYYQYQYDGTSADFTGTARGDLNGDGVFSTFTIQGKVQNDALILAPSIQETNPEE